MPGTYALDLYRGDSYAWRFTLFEDDPPTVPTDLTGATAEAEIREKTAGVNIVAMTCVVTLPNIIDMTLDPDQYAACPAKGVWDLQVTYPDGWVQTVLHGTVTVTGDVTDSAVMPTRSALR